MKIYKFKATLLKDDKRGWHKAGQVFDPKGIYYNGNKVILVGSVKENHVTRLAFPVEDVKVEIM